ncbi:hypothetical protein B0T24DRAFT_629862 [Lasiosphaeria ovina]|uniref:Uncharacterized protein n=1 Tax=Lasiosphaeria ovina TaxID=92902 RepID=A0AAE0K7N6_9PEZI|nr:hypothetical protein B0T24DRAFT_629862 [Lasiosphaeria ovina]
MSGSGGFYKYRCKYFITQNCQNWVWVNYATCACSLADGRESGEAFDDGEKPIVFQSESEGLKSSGYGGSPHLSWQQVRTYHGLDLLRVVESEKHS